jgi:hypothetical protein
MLKYTTPPHSNGSVLQYVGTLSTWVREYVSTFGTWLVTSHVTRLPLVPWLHWFHQSCIPCTDCQSFQVLPEYLYYSVYKVRNNQPVCLRDYGGLCHQGFKTVVSPLQLSLFSFVVNRVFIVNSLLQLRAVTITM